MKSFSLKIILFYSSLPINYLFLPLFLFCFTVNNTVLAQTITQKDIKITSQFLKREVQLSILLPSDYEHSKHPYPVLYLNDGQDLPRLRMLDVLTQLYQEKSIPHFILVGIHADKNRLQEYGTAARPDYAHRGSLASQHTQFVLEELIPYIEKHFPVQKSFKHTFYAGFSLGGLSALDIVWHHGDKFSKVGVFSGSLWWRKKALDKGYDENTDRIMHDLIRQGKYQKHLKFWFQNGTEDEKEDRNNNGIIDAIDDTLDLIKELKTKGYQTDKQVVYHEMLGGTHDPETWHRAMPVFLKWLFE